MATTEFMSSSLEIVPPDNFSFHHTVRSHGWYDLAPLVLSDDDTLSCVLRRGKGGAPLNVSVSESNGSISINVEARSFDREGIIRDISHILRLDEAFDDFYEHIDKHDRVAWAKTAKAGRLLRSATVWEDLVKTICTTNCTWALTRIMVNNLVELLGEPSTGGRKAFPTAMALAECDEAFYRSEVKTGYRSPFFVELAKRVVDGDLDPESWLTSELSTKELRKEMKGVKGVGDYAAENLLKLVGRYDGLALDSWLRGGFYKKHNGGKKCKDTKIERHYARFREWQGLAIWCDMTEDWFGEKGRKGS